MTASMRQWSLTTGAALLVIALTGSSMINRFFNRMTFQPAPGVHADAAALGVPLEEVTIRTADDVRLHSFYLPRPESDRAVLFLHGNAGNATDRLPLAKGIAALGASVLLPDYRGYGFSEGSPDEQGLYLDARAALRHLIDDRGYSPDRIVVMGRSLGGAAAVDLVADQPVGGLVLISTLQSAQAMARNMGLGLFAPLIGRRLDSEGKIPGITVPILMFHGERDEIVPVAQGEALFAVAPEPKTMLLIRGAQHNDIIDVAGGQFWQPLARFLDEVTP
jgi:pimeloyl-ACP methyl ester carboxylesterase